MTKFVNCGRCGTVYDMHGTHGTTTIRGYCPMCGLHHSGTHSIAYPVLKPSPLAAEPIDIPEIVRCRDCKHYGIYNGSWCRRTYEPVPNGIYDYQTVEPDGFCAWGERKE